MTTPTGAMEQRLLELQERYLLERESAVRRRYVLLHAKWVLAKRAAAQMTLGDKPAQK